MSFAAKSLTRSPLTRSCPFCGALLELNDCRIISTAPGAGLGRHALSEKPWVAVAEADSSPDPTPNGDGNEGTDSRILHDPGLSHATSVPRRSSWMAGSGSARPLVSLRSLDPRLIPRRECPGCREPLPTGLDRADTRIVSVVGVNVAGKSNFLGAALNLAVEGGLDEFGITRFSPEPDTSKVLHNEYYLKLFRTGDVLELTKADFSAVKRPMTFDVEVGGTRHLFVTHDVSGELLGDHLDRALGADFVRRSVGLIFVLDPTEFEGVRRALPPHLREKDRSMNQVDLLEHVIEELDQANVPVAVVVAKSDLLAALSPGRSFLKPRQRDAVLTRDLQQVSDEVKEMLTELGQGRIVRLARDHGHCTFHAVSSLGGTVEEVQRHGIRPVRVLDPLGVVLRRVAERVQ